MRMKRNLPAKTWRSWRKKPIKDCWIWFILTVRGLTYGQKWFMRGKSAANALWFRWRAANRRMYWVLCGIGVKSFPRSSLKAQLIPMWSSVALTWSPKALKRKPWSSWTMPRSIGAREFAEKIEEWEKQGLKIYFLPTYCPSLNKIELLWKKIKYDWLTWDAYSSYKNLCRELDEILAQVGSKYYITFA